MPRRVYDGAIPVSAASPGIVAVDPLDVLAIYVNGEAILSWRRQPDDAQSQAWWVTQGPTRVWPVDVPAGVHILVVTPTGGAPASLLRLAPSSH